MLDHITETFSTINRGFDSTFQAGRMSLGLVAPIAAYPDCPVPDMAGHIARVQQAEALGFRAIWLRDVPFNVASFGDAGQGYDPFTYLGFLAGQTTQIALGVASLVLPLRHPAHVAKAAASVDVLSQGRLILGVASGDRPDEYPAMNIDFDGRAAAMRDAVAYIRAMAHPSPRIHNRFGQIDGAMQGPMEMLPKPHAARLPLLITGSSRQSPDWIARNGDGWITYPRPALAQAQAINQWRMELTAAQEPPKPVLQPLYVDLADDPDEGPTPIHLGLRTGHRYLTSYLKDLEAAGVNHVALNLRFNRTPIDQTLDRLARDVLPYFH
jgi:luciferase-type oxidoreductase